MSNSTSEKLLNSDSIRAYVSENYNYVFNKRSGEFHRWGETVEDDAEYAKIGPEILDIEISTGSCLGKCKFCYKSNDNACTPTHHMTLAEFKTIIDKMDGNLMQVALGITDVNANPDFFAMMEYCRSKGIIPNYTTHGLDMSDKNIEDTIRLCGAVAVSIVDEKKSFDTIRRLLASGMKYVNIHLMLSQQTTDKAFRVINTIKNDPSLRGVTAIVFLQYKAKGGGSNAFTPVRDMGVYSRLFAACKDAGIGYGGDSCSAPMFFKAIDKNLHNLLEPCESGLFSSYVNSHGIFFPCSFMEGELDWRDGLSVLNCVDFVQDVWLSNRLEMWRTGIMNSSSNCKCEFKKYCRSCPRYDISVCKDEN